MYYNINTNDIESFENLLHENNIEFYSSMDPLKFVVEELVQEVYEADYHDVKFREAVENNFESIERLLYPKLKDVFKFKSSALVHNLVYESIDDVIRPRIIYLKKENNKNE